MTTLEEPDLKTSIGGHAAAGPGHAQYQGNTSAAATSAVSLLDLYHTAALGTCGQLNLTAIDPSSEQVTVERFPIGQADPMARRALALSSANNIYFAPVVLRLDLRPGARGSFSDIVAVLGLVIDEDADTDKLAILPENVLPTITVTTSRVPHLNRHHHFVFAQALTPDEGKDLAVLLHKKCGGDFGTKDVAHVWRVPGTLNYPTDAKISRGRPKTPQRVEIAGGSFELIDAGRLRTALDRMPDFKELTHQSGGNSSQQTYSAAIPPWLQLLMQSEQPLGDRSEHCYRVLQGLFDLGLTDEEVLAASIEAPFARKYAQRGDLATEIARVRAKRRQSGESKPEGEKVDPWPVLSGPAARGLVGEIAAAATENSEADPVAVLASALTWGGAVFGRSIRFSLGDSAHHPRLFCALVGASSRARKGTSLDPVRRIFYAAEAELHKQSTLPFPSGLHLKISHGPLSSGEGLIDAIRDKRNEEDSQGVDDKRLLCLEGEFGAVLRASQRQGNTLSTVMRVAWDGWKISPLTKHDKISATDPHICIIAHITRQELRELLTTTDVWNGFANRFLWLAVRRQRVVPLPEAIPDSTVSAIARELAKVIQHAHSAAGPTADLVMSNSAREHWIHVYPELTFDHPGLLGAVTSRAEAQALRLAMTYALFDCAARIELHHVEAALAFWRYAFDSARQIFGSAETDPIAQRIIAALTTGPKSQTDIVNLFGRNVAKPRIDSVLKDLQERGRVTLTVVGTGGRPRMVWELALTD